MQCYDWSGLYYLYIFWSIWTGNDALSLRKRNGYWMAVLVKCGESVSCLVMFYFLQAYGQQPTRFLCPWDFPGKNPGADCHFLLQRIFQTQSPNPHPLGLLIGRQILLPLSHVGSPSSSSTGIFNKLPSSLHLSSFSFVFFCIAFSCLGLGICSCI